MRAIGLAASFASLLACLASLPVSGSARADEAPAASQAFGVEILGRSILYGIAYERAIGALPFELGLGLSSASLEAAAPGGREPRALLVPAYAIGKLRALPGEGWRWSAGVTWLAHSSEDPDGRRAIYGGIEFGALPLVFNAGIGHEWRAASGFLLRANLLAQVAGNIAPGFSLNLAYAL